MLLFIDNGVPRKFERLITVHQVTLVREAVWHELEIGRLIPEAGRV
jgi:hypothetical protein